MSQDLHTARKDASATSHRFGIRWIAFLLIASPATQIVADDSVTRSIAADSGEIVFSESCDQGIVFIDGVYIPSPYQITATKDSVLVNDVAVKSLPDAEDWDANFGESEPRTRRGAGMAGRRGEPRRNEQPRPQRGGGMFSQRQGQQGPQRIGAQRQAERLCQMLTDDGSVILAFAENPLVYVSKGDVMYSLFAHFINGGSSEENQQTVLRSIPSLSTRSLVEDWMNDYQPPASVIQQMQSEVDQIDSLMAADRKRSDAMVRMDTLAYPLTLIAMMLGVVALGHILKWTAHNIVSGQNGSISKQSIHGVEIALLLMAGMSAVDLAWTILASQAGVMREVNPMAAGMIDSPLTLAVFKVIATSLGFGLLYALRTHKRGQEVTWWMCLVCVLVTFRWVLFDSMA